MAEGLFLKTDVAFDSRYLIKTGFFHYRYFVTRIVLTYCEKKFEAESREFAKILRSLEQFIQTVKGQNNFWLNRMLF